MLIYFHFMQPTRSVNAGLRRCKLDPRSSEMLHITYLPTFRDNLSVLSSSGRQCCLLDP